MKLASTEDASASHAPMCCSSPGSNRTPAALLLSDSPPAEVYSAAADRDATAPALCGTSGSLRCSCDCYASESQDVSGLRRRWPWPQRSWVENISAPDGGTLDQFAVSAFTAQLASFASGPLFSSAEIIRRAFQLGDFPTLRSELMALRWNALLLRADQVAAACANVERYILANNMQHANGIRPGNLTQPEKYAFTISSVSKSRERGHSKPRHEVARTSVDTSTGRSDTQLVTRDRCTGSTQDKDVMPNSYRQENGVGGTLKDSTQWEQTGARLETSNCWAGIEAAASGDDRQCPTEQKIIETRQCGGAMRQPCGSSLPYAEVCMYVCR
eukprot:GHVT01023324.1.p1 GENE.GHVT01023324.1~~GHVT01023324.1.p1  ORF type:complete len:329 (+),score=40.73 GHVT01023324.1:1039-2025(+)